MSQGTGDRIEWMVPELYFFHFACRINDPRRFQRAVFGGGKVRVTDAIEHIREIDLDIKGTWGAYDLEWIRELWIGGLRRSLDQEGKPAEELF